MYRNNCVTSVLTSMIAIKMTLMHRLNQDPCPSSVQFQFVVHQ